MKIRLGVRLPWDELGVEDIEASYTMSGVEVENDWDRRDMERECNLNEWTGSHRRQATLHNGDDGHSVAGQDRGKVHAPRATRPGNYPGMENWATTGRKVLEMVANCLQQLVGLRDLDNSERIRNQKVRSRNGKAQTQI